MGLRALLTSIAVAATCCAVLAPAALAATGETSLISRADGAAGAKGSASSTEPSVSADCSLVAFQTTADNFDPADTDVLQDIYVRGVQTGETSLVSRADGAAGAAGNGDSYAPSVSADGRFVVFSSYATNIDPDDTDATADIFLRDTQTAQTTLISRADGANGAKGTNASLTPSISANGRFVAFASLATNLDPADPDTFRDIYLRDTQTDETSLISRSDGVAGPKGAGESLAPTISANGRSIAFWSTATNLDPADSDATGDVFVRDTQTSETTLVSRADGAGGAKGSGNSANPSISAAGRFITFSSSAANLAPDDVDTTPDIFLRDTQTDETTLVSRADGVAGAKGNDMSFTPSISAAGRYIAFHSAADNLDPDDVDTSSDIFLRDTQTDETTLVSRADGAAGAKANGGSANPAISADGRFVGFDSTADNLDPDDTDGISDVFLRRVDVDDTAPETTIDSGPAEGSTIATDSATFTFSSSEVGSTFTCSLDGAATACDSGARTYSSLGNAAHSFEVAATDAAANTDPTPAIRIFTVAPPAAPLAPAASSPASVDGSVDGLDVTAKKSQKQGKQIKVTVKVGAGERIEATRSGKIKTKRPKKSYGLKTNTTTIDGKRTVLKLKLKSGKHASKITNALKKWRKASRKQRSKLAVEAPVKVKVTDAAGNKAKQKLVVTLK